MLAAGCGAQALGWGPSEPPGRWSETVLPKSPAPQENMPPEFFMEETVAAARPRRSVRQKPLPLMLAFLMYPEPSARSPLDFPYAPAPEPILLRGRRIGSFARRTETFLPLDAMIQELDGSFFEHGTIVLVAGPF